MNSPQRCECGSESFETQKDIGFDIWEGGEEKQHVDICKCGKVRLWADVLIWGEDWTKNYGKWEDKVGGIFDPW